jgi:5' nucleotidase, deoxy (Pyrimidine), cytosolic type C protein (NT5C)
MKVNRRFVFGVDIDGVCADFYRGLRPIAAEWLGVDVSTLPERLSWGLPEWGSTRRLVDTRRFTVLP